jgi:hypothetical protein
VLMRSPLAEIVRGNRNRFVETDKMFSYCPVTNLSFSVVRIVFFLLQDNRPIVSIRAIPILIVDFINDSRISYIMVKKIIVNKCL